MIRRKKERLTGERSNGATGIEEEHVAGGAARALEAGARKAAETADWARVHAVCEGGERHDENDVAARKLHLQTREVV